MLLSSKIKIRTKRFIMQLVKLFVKNTLLANLNQYLESILHNKRIKTSNMNLKKFFPLTFLAVIAFACGQNQSERNVELLQDNATHSNNNMISDSAQSENATVTTPEAPETPAPAPSASNSNKTVKKATTVSSGKQSGTQTREEEAKTESSNSNTTVTDTKTETTTTAGTGATESVKKEKKGISKAAEGAIIGAAAGAVGGATVSKKKGTGAAIGAVVGAAGGYIIGKSKDNKDKKKDTTKNH